MAVVQSLAHSRSPVLTGLGAAASSFKYVEVLKTRRKSGHSHPQVEILLVTAGEGTRIIGDTLAPFGPGDLFVLGSHLPHTFFPSPGAAGEVRTLVIQFRPADIGPALAAFPEFQGLPALLERARRGLFVGGSTREAVAALMRRIGSHPPASPRRMGLFVALLAELAESEDLTLAAGPMAAPLRDGRMDERLDLICRLVQSHLVNPLTQGALAERAGMSPPAFSRWFKRLMGRSYTDYVSEARIDLACRALLESDREVARIALELGFAGESRFQRVFKAVKGVPPSEYRRLSRAAEAAASIISTPFPG